MAAGSVQAIEQAKVLGDAERHPRAWPGYLLRLARVRATCDVLVYSVFVETVTASTSRALSLIVTDLRAQHTSRTQLGGALVPRKVLNTREAKARTRFEH
jgi:hypothetical protein